MSIPSRRHKSRVSVILDLLDPEGRVLGFARNISESGMLVTSTVSRPCGDLVHFKAPTFSGGAEVVWTHEYDVYEVLIGLKFVLLSGRDRNALRELLEPAQHVG